MYPPSCPIISFNVMYSKKNKVIIGWIGSISSATCKTVLTSVIPSNGCVAQYPNAVGSLKEWWMLWTYL